MEDRDVEGALRELPRLGAAEDFSRRVLDRIHRKEEAPGRGRRRAIALMLAVAAAGGAWQVRRIEQRRAEAVRIETRAIAREIERMKNAIPSPVIDLGREGNVRYVVDLRRIPGSRSGVL
jgi:hypothetical protein